MHIATVHFFDLGMGQTIALLGLAAFVIAVGAGLAKGLGFWGAVSQAPGGSGIIDTADNLMGLINFYDAFCLKHMGVIATTEQWVIFREYYQAIGKEIEEQKARNLVKDLQPILDMDALREKVARNGISPDDFAIADTVADRFPDIQAMTAQSAAEVENRTGGSPDVPT